MKYIMLILGIILVLVILLTIVYFVLIFKMGKINLKLYKKKEEIDLKDKHNVLIVYQPSRRKTTFKIKELIKNYLVKKGYGYKITTLNKDDEDYKKYEYTIFVMPVYFGEVNREFFVKLHTSKIKNLIVIYNGLNENSNNEDALVKKASVSKYSKIKLHTKDVDRVIEFLTKEGL